MLYTTTVKRLLRRIAKDPSKVVYGGTDPFNDLKQYVAVTKQGGKIVCYITPDGYIECAFSGIKPWIMYQSLQPLFFDVVYVDTKKVKTFRGGKADEVIKRVVQNLV